MATGLKSNMVKKCSTLKWTKKSGLGTKMDMKWTKYVSFDLKMAADILTFSCESTYRPWNFRLSRISRDPSPTMCPPKI